MTATELAAALGIARNTLYKHRRQPGAPQDWDLERWQQYLRLRRATHGLAPAAGEPNGEKAEAAAELPDGEALPDARGVGAAAALQRLSDLEEVFHRRLLNALASQDAAAVVVARDNWLKVSESLRRYDLVVAEARRAGERQMPQGEAEKGVRAAAVWLRQAVAAWLSSDAPALSAIQDPRELAAAVWRGLTAAVGATVDQSAKARAPLPAWAAELVREEWPCA